MILLGIPRCLLAAAAAASLGLWSAGASAHAERRPLYEGSAPGSESWSQPRTEIVRNGSVSVYNTSQPVYELHLPRAERASGAALVMLPGGGLRTLGTGAALRDEVDALVAQGITVLVLEYRTLQLAPEELRRLTAQPSAPPTSSGAPPRFPRMEIVNGNANPAAGDARMGEVLRLATEDAQAALRLLHDRSKDWNIDPDRIGVMGTSAGGGVAFGTLLDRSAPPEERPDFLVSIFGPSLQDVTVWEGAPPLFMAVEAEHGAVTDGLIEVFRIWNEAYQPAELHVFDVPNFSMTEKLWGPRLFDWMRGRGILRSAAE
jgi:acetyl esterase/lipase